MRHTADSVKRGKLFGLAKAGARVFRDALNLAFVWWASRPGLRGVHVWYGLLAVPSRDRAAFGGIVKVQHLTDVFPSASRRFNLLYLVSSQLPPTAVSVAALAQRRGVRLVWNQDGVAYAGWHGPGWERINRPMATLLHRADHVFYQSEFCRLGADKFLGARQGPSEVLYNPVDTRAFVPGSARGRPGLVVLAAGSSQQFYRLEVALRALARLRTSASSARLVVAGRLAWRRDADAARAEALALVAQLGLEAHVEFLGTYTQADAPRIFRSADVLLHTKYNDPCPTVVLEAMATGLPVVYSASGGVPELVGPDAGIGIPAELRWDVNVPPDPDAMAEAVMSVMERYESYAEAARQRAVERFDVEHWLNRHREVFEELVP